MRTSIKLSLAALILALAVPGVRADAPHVYAITKARIVTAAGADISSGTVVIRRNVIEAVGANVTPPADAYVIDGTGMTVYPGPHRHGPGRHARCAGDSPTRERFAPARSSIAGGARTSCAPTSAPPATSRSTRRR